jgi:hypothetical protein
MDTHNVFRECNEENKDNLRNSDARVRDFLTPLFSELSKKRPTWTYVAKGFGDLSASGTFYYYSRFTIMDGGQDIGEVWASKNWRTGENKYAFNNHRLQTTRRRGNCTETKDLKKAVKLILANMYALTTAELMNTIRSQATNKARNTVYTIQRDFRYERDKLLPNMEAFIMDNWEAFENYNTHSLTDKQRFKERYTSAAKATEAEQLLGDNKYALVVDVGDQIHVEHSAHQGAIHSYTLDGIPLHIKQGVAILKLCDVDTLLDGVGVRTGDATYIIFDGENHD